MFALAKYFASKNYWAKDIIFLISDADLLGTQAWLNAYHAERSTGPLTSDPLPASSGPIQAAINLELHSTQMTSIDIKIEGLNGQLPNLDLFNVAVELCTRESVTPTFHKVSHPYAGPEYDVWKQYAATTLSMMRSQAASWPTGAHGLFQRFAIQSITLTSTGARSSQSEKQYAGVRLQQAGRVIEGIFRSLNNLLERFNRSYWFYLLPSTRRYLSIGYYMIPFALITCPLILTALRGYIRLSQDKQQDELDPDPTGQAKNRKLPSQVHEEESEGLADGIPFWFFAHLMGLVLVSIPYIMERHAYDFVTSGSHSMHDAVYFTIVAFSLILIMTPVFLQSERNKLSQKVLCLLNSALLFSCISLSNISLALLLSLICTPVLCVVGQPVICMSKARSLTNRALLLLIHPISMNYWSHFVMSVYLHSELRVSEHVLRAFDSQRTSLLSCIENWYIYGHWMYLLSCAFIFPVWLQAWSST
jgi:glycosylphosphatidylinositol transamidase